MLGGRALLAFQGCYEKNPDGTPTADALLGAIMTSEAQAAQTYLMEAFGKFVEAWARVHRG